MADAELSTDKLSSFGSDGASVMVGNRNGVAAKLREHNAGLLSVHCVAHRLALATAQAGNQVPYLKKVKDWLAALWKHFHYSSVRAAGLVEVQRLMNMEELKIVKAGDTRWLSHHASVTTMLRILPALLRALHMEGAKDPTAYGLHHCIATYSFVAALHLLEQSLVCVTRLSRAFQSADVDLSIIHPLISSTKTRLQRLKDKTAAAFEKEVQDIIVKVEAPTTVSAEVEEDDRPGDADHDGDEPDEVEDDDSEAAYQPSIAVGAGEKERFERTRLQFMQGLLDNLDQRFPSAEVLDAFSALQPQQLEEPCAEKLSTLYRHYANSPLAIDQQDLMDEWEEFTSFAASHPGMKKATTLQGMAQELLGKESIASLFPLISKLYARAVTLPVSTADCERAFSTMNRIKTDLRNRLKTSTLEKLMFIALEGPERNHFDFAAAADRWAGLRNRRVFNS